MSTGRRYSLLDKLITESDRVLRTLNTANVSPTANSPAADIEADDLSESERKHAAGLMRVNHSGEVCAQALYQSQLLYSQSDQVTQVLKQSSIEENNHLIWCSERIAELGGKTSLLNPFFYSHSFILGAIAGSFGDQYSLGFVVETEKQVEQHLNNYINKLPSSDKKSMIILKQMRQDEIEHGQKAKNQGAMQLPKWIQKLMNLSSKAMTKTTYYL